MRFDRSMHSSILVLLLLGLLVLPATACKPREGDAAEEKAASSEKKDSEDGEEGEEEQAVPVEVVELGRGRIESLLRFSSNLEAENTVQVFAQASRLVTRLAVEEGDEVRRGDLLVRLQDEEQRSALERAESQLAKSRREYERQKRLFDRELISEQAWNDAVYDLEQLEIAVADARRELGYTEVRAPISGIVTSRLVKLGDHVTVNQHLFDLVDFDSIVARLYVPERELVRLRLGQAVRVQSESWGDATREATLIRIAPIVDPRTGTIKVTASVPHREGVVPGMFVEAELVTAVHEDALLVPKRALVYDSDQAFVFRLTDDERVERLLLRPLLEDNEYVEPDDSLSEGDRLVVAGQAGLKDGALVRVVEDET